MRDSDIGQMSWEELNNEALTGEELDSLRKEFEIMERSREIPSYGDLMTLEEFEMAVTCHAFLDEDGTGYYSDGIHMSTNVAAVPSRIIEGDVRREYSHIVWFNK